MVSTRTGVRALVMVTLCYGALEIVGLLLLLLLLVMHDGMPYGRIEGQGQGHDPFKV